MNKDAAIALPRAIHIRATNYDGTPHWSHAAQLIEHSEGLFVTRTDSGIPVQTERGVWNSPYDTSGHYWPDRWYNVIYLLRNWSGIGIMVASPNAATAMRPI